MQIDRPGASAKVPGEHSVRLVAPMEHDEPIGQIEQLEALFRLGAFEKRPAGHGRGAELPEGQKLPGGQSLQRI